MTAGGGADQQTRQNAVYRRMIEVSDRVAYAALSGANAMELTKVFAEATNKTVVLVDPSLHLRASWGEAGDVSAQWDPEDVAVARVLHALAAEGRPMRVPALARPDGLTRGYVATPIAIVGTVLGYLLLFDEHGGQDAGDEDLLIASYASTLFALSLAHERTSTDLGLRYQGAIVDGLVSGHFLDAADARRKALSIGLPSNVPFRVGVVRMPAPSRVVSLDELVGTFVASVPGVVAAGRGEDVVMIVPEPDGRPDRDAGPAVDTMAELSERMANAGVGQRPTGGLSERTARPDLAPQAVRQAELAIDIGVRLGRTGQVIVYDELGIYRLLLQFGDMQVLCRFAEDVLGPLLEYDQTHKVELVRTLSVYLSEHASLKQTARRLRMHVNTISYRVRRIEQLAPLDLDNPEDRLMAHVAVKIIESLRQGHERTQLSPTW